MLALAALACGVPFDDEATVPPPGGETAEVWDVIDGDTIDVLIDGQEYRVRYIGVNSPETDEPCYEAALVANADLVEGQVVTLVADVSETDRYGRLLRYVYVDDTFVNARLVEDGWAEAVTYEPDVAYETLFQDMELSAAEAGLGCHPTGVFEDGSLER